MAATAMMQQYHEAKGACGDALLLFRMGDFYELFYDDAKTAAQALGLTLTSRDKSDNPIPMAGFPHHQLETYLGRLIRQGHRVAICEQVEDPKYAKGLVRRDVTRVVTPGTLTDDELLQPSESNYLAAIVGQSRRSGTRRDEREAEYGIAWVELSTGEFWATSVPETRVADELCRIQPAECVTSEDDPHVRHHVASIPLTTRPVWEFGWDTARQALLDHFKTTTLSGFGFDDDQRLPIRAAGAIIAYLRETQRSSLDHIDRLLPYDASKQLQMDQATRRGLELTRTLRDGQREGSLLAALDRTVTAMGSRLLADWLASPLADKQAIETRLDAVEELVSDAVLCQDLKAQLEDVYDLERLVARVATGRASPRDLAFVGRTLRSLPRLKAKLTGRTSQRLQLLEAELDLCPDLRAQLDAALVDDCPLSARDGGIIRTGYHAPLDELRQLAAGGKQWIAEYQAREVQRSGIPSMKVGYNQVFGYYIEITHAHRDRIPSDYIRKQTLKNAERYITPELKEYEEKVLSADEKAKELEYELFLELRGAVQANARRLRGTARVLAELDVLASLAELARQRHYCRPQLMDEPILDIVDGRHPVLDLVELEGTFVPNDTTADDESGNLVLITGPNMAGKSTYIRQVALLTILAHMGSFIPAAKAVIGMTDRVFARIGASDELARGQSTFMVEMTETARILNTATRRSLVILDEIGRGTSTYDGLSLAWAIVEHVHDRIGCRTFFATHYHELTDLAKSLPAVKNLNVAVKEWEDTVVFLHKIVPGAADKSYGIHVARLAGVPREVNQRAQQILAQLEAEHLDGSGRARISSRDSSRRRGEIQLTLFGPQDHPLLDEIRALDLNRLTPIDALARIQRWQEQLRVED